MSRSEKKEWGLETLLSVIGFVFELVRTVVAALRKRSGTVDHLRRLLREPELVDKVFDLIVGQPPAPLAAPSWWSQFLAALIRVCQFVPYVNPDITGENFPLCDGDLAPKSVEIISIEEYLQKLGKSLLSTLEVKAYLDVLGYRPATLVELLFWWLQNPAKWSNCLVVALGSAWCGNVPYVYGDGSFRKLNLYSTENVWNEVYEFAAVRISA